MIGAVLCVLVGVSEAWGDWCAVIPSGQRISVLHRRGHFRNARFTAELSCSYDTPVRVFLRGGGVLCAGDILNGLNHYDRPFTCVVTRVTRVR